MCVAKGARRTARRSVPSICYVAWHGRTHTYIHIHTITPRSCIYPTLIYLKTSFIQVNPLAVMNTTHYIKAVHMHPQSAMTYPTPGVQ